MINPKLRSDVEIKRAFAAALHRNWQEPNEQDDANECLALREICLPSDGVGEGAIIPPTDPAKLTTNYIYTDVFVFCPIALPGWQQRAKQVLEEQVLNWRKEIEKLQHELRDPMMHAVPFGRFLDRQQDSKRWVSDIAPVEMKNGMLFKNCSLAGIPPGGTSPIWYYSRPFILWPLRPGTLTHVTFVAPKPPAAGGREVYITRPPLDHPLLRQGQTEEPVAEPVPPPVAKRRRLFSWLRT